MGIICSKDRIRQRQRRSRKGSSGGQRRGSTGSRRGSNSFSREALDSKRGSTDSKRDHRRGSSESKIVPSENETNHSILVETIEKDLNASPQDIDREHMEEVLAVLARRYPRGSRRVSLPPSLPMGMITEMEEKSEAPTAANSHTSAMSGVTKNDRAMGRPVVYDEYNIPSSSFGNISVCSEEELENTVITSASEYQDYYGPSTTVRSFADVSPSALIQKKTSRADRTKNIF